MVLSTCTMAVSRMTSFRCLRPKSSHDHHWNISNATDLSRLGVLTLPCPAPCSGLFHHPTDFHPQQTLASPWRTWSDNSQCTLPVQTQAATRWRRSRKGWDRPENTSMLVEIDPVQNHVLKKIKYFFQTFCFFSTLFCTRASYVNTYTSMFAPVSLYSGWFHFCKHCVDFFHYLIHIHFWNICTWSINEPIFIHVEPMFNLRVNNLRTINEVHKLLPISNCCYETYIMECTYPCPKCGWVVEDQKVYGNVYSL